MFTKVVRYADGGKSALLVYHCFKDSKMFEIELDYSMEIESSLY